MRERGLSLIELLIAMLLGLFIAAGVGRVFQSSRQTYRSVESLSQLQESARSTFELLSHDLRQSGLGICGDTRSLANVVNGASDHAFFHWVGLRGFDGEMAAPHIATGTGIGQRVAGTSAIHLQGVSGNGFAIAKHMAAAASFKMNAAETDLAVGDIVMVCDVSQATLFQITHYVSNSLTLKYETGLGIPGNCSTGLGFPSNCTSTLGNPYTYGANASIARFLSTIWYIGNNGRPDEGGQSLYRLRLGENASLVTEEIVAGVNNLQIRYHERGATAWSTAASVDAANNWSAVDAVELALGFESAETQVVTDTPISEGRLQHDMTLIIALRNRIQ